MTLLELLVALSLLLIFISMAVPVWHSFLVRGRVTALANRLVAAIHFARNEAIERNQTVTLCGSRDGLHCDGPWSQGQIIQLAATKHLLRYYKKYPSDYHLLWRSSLKKNNALNFTAEGFTQGQQGTFYLCPPSDEKQAAVALVVTRSGRLRRDRAKVYASCQSVGKD